MRLVLFDLERAGTVNVKPRTRAIAADRYQPKSRRLLRLRPLERIVQDRRDEAAHADSPDGRFTTDLHGESVFKGNRRPHGVQSITTLHLCIKRLMFQTAFDRSREVQ